METMPVKVPRGRAPKYDWETLSKRGWIFVPREEGHVDQGSSIRAAARNKGLHVSALSATHEGVAGLLVEVRP